MVVAIVTGVQPRAVWVENLTVRLTGKEQRFGSSLIYVALQQAKGPAFEIRKQIFDIPFRIPLII